MERGLLVLIIAIVLLQSFPAESKACSKSSKLHRKTFRSPAFTLAPGEVQDRFYEIEFPKGHVGIKNFLGEVVDELGKSVPLSEVYLHHWVVFDLYVKSSDRKELVKAAGFHTHGPLRSSSAISAGNDGICQHNILPQYWGLGSETRHTDYSIPGSYAIEIGDRSKIPDGYEEVFELNIHAIDIRGTEDPQGCTECRRDLYNVTSDASGQLLEDSYIGGLRCCYEGTQCKVKTGFEGPPRTLYLEYTIEWVEWDECVLPVRAYIFDITDSRKRDPIDRHVGCKIEYNVPACDTNDCMHLVENHLVIPKGGSIVYGVAHQHSGARGMTLHGQDGRHLCSSIPMYGNGSAPGNEDGFIVGISSCSPELGSVQVESGEELHLASYYSSEQAHTGVMALFYLLVVDDENLSHSFQGGDIDGMALSVVVVALLAAIVALVGYTLRKKAESKEYNQLLSA